MTALLLCAAAAFSMSAPYEPPPGNLDELAPPDNGPPGVTADIVAMVHAPVHYQDTHEDKAHGDYLTAVDYDGNWVGWDNWDNLDANAQIGTVYYTVAETCTHWFVVYGMFHPQDWGAGGIITRFEHENDFEGLLAIITKDGSTGRLEALVTVFHHDFYSYVAPGSPLVDGEEDIDGTVSFELWDGVLHPMTVQEAEGHGLKAWPYAGDFDGIDGDGVTYVPAWTGAQPASGTARDVPYPLRPFEPMWQLQLDESLLPGPQAMMYADFGIMEGNDSGSCGAGRLFTCTDDAAHLPWAWDDGDDNVPSGLHALDPAALADAYFDGAFFDRTYVRHPLVEALQARGYTDATLPAGWPDNVSFEALAARLGTCT